MALDSPAEIDEVLVAAKIYSLDELGAEIRGLQRRLGTASKNVLKNFQDLKRSKNFTAVSAALEQYADDKCPEELADDYRALQEWWETLKGEAKDALTTATSATHPADIDVLLESYETYGQSLSAELSAIKDRRQTLIGDANTALLDVANNAGATLQELEAALEQYSSYPAADVRKAKDQVKTKLAVICDAAPV